MPSPKPAPLTGARNPPAPARRVRAIPSFSLYGEAANPRVELLHIEEVQSRSRLYQWEIDAHVHHGLHQVLWLRQGTADTVLDEWHGGVTGPAAILVPPGVVHGFRFAPGTDGLVLTLSARFLLEGELESAGQALGALFAEPATLPLQAGDAAVQRLDALFGELAREFLQPGAPQGPVVVWLARAVIWRLAQVHAQARKLPEQGARAHRHQALFTRFQLLLEQHFLDHWTLTAYASRLGLSVPRLNRLARAASGRSALELVHERLTREACRRLVFIAAPAARLASELGFEDPAYFARFFRRHTGMSPQQYRLAHQAQHSAGVVSPGSPG